MRQGKGAIRQGCIRSTRAQRGVRRLRHPVLAAQVRGPNGAGKTSMFRVVGGLWEVQHSAMSSPASSAPPGLAHANVKV